MARTCAISLLLTASPGIVEHEAKRLLYCNHTEEVGKHLVEALSSNISALLFNALSRSRVAAVLALIACYGSATIKQIRPCSVERTLEG